MATYEGRPTPVWFDDAKFGMMITWGPYSVPGYAPRSGRIWDVPDQFKNNPYAEWYRNSLKIDGSPVQEYHAREYGADYPYERFGPAFNEAIKRWDPGSWATLLADCGVRYVVPLTKHHDGFLLWPSVHRNPNAPERYVAERDVIGELGAAVRAAGMRYGLYYSGGIDWLYHDVTIRTDTGLGPAIPRSPEYIAYAFAHWREIIDRYEPALMWNDIYMPGPREQLADLFEHYYSVVPDGVINDRFKARMGPTGMEVLAHHDVKTPEYRVEPEIRADKWECVRGIGHSFGYNRDEGETEYASAESLIHLLIDIVSKNGNLLLNIGPMADGTIPALQEQRLQAIGAWLRTNGEGIYGSRPWHRAEGTTTSGTPLRFTRKGGDLYVHVLGQAPGAVSLEGVQVPTGPARLLATGAEVPMENEGSGISLQLPAALDATASTILLPGAAG